MAEERDFVLARVAAARNHAADMVSALDDYITLAINPDEDKKGETRKELLEAVLDDAGYLSRAVEAAQDLEYDFTEGEPEIPQEDGFDDDGA